MTKTNIILAVAVLIIIAAVAAWYFLWRQPAAPSTPGAAAGTEGGLGADIYNQVAPNAAQNLPETNPFKAVQTNPFQ